jgi:signal transduction histidine kinase
MPPHRRPAWWPENEPWPPERGAWRGRGSGPWGGHAGQWGGRPWWGPGRRRGGFARRLGCALVLFGVVLASVGLLVLFLIGSVLGLDVFGGELASVATPAGVVGVILGVVALFAVTRVLRGITTPLGALDDAAGRVEHGDYTARVEQPERGPGELRTLVATFNTMAARLEAEDETRRRLLADVSHELRTPLAVIQGNLEALVDGVYPPDEAHLRPILDETRVLERLIDDLRTLSLADSGTLPLHREPTAPAVLLEDVAAAHRAGAAAAGIQIRVEAAAGLPMLDVDPVRIKQVVSNLVENAVRAMPSGGSIVISAHAEPSAHAAAGATHPNAGSVFIEVTDDGPGIAPELRSTLFDRFTKSATSRGSGLGLAIARAIVSAHGGTIDASPGPAGAGTTLRISLPSPPARAKPFG